MVDSLLILKWSLIQASAAPTCRATHMQWHQKAPAIDRQTLLTQKPIAAGLEATGRRHQVYTKQQHQSNHQPHCAQHSAHLYQVFHHIDVVAGRHLTCCRGSAQVATPHVHHNAEAARLGQHPRLLRAAAVVRRLPAAAAAAAAASPATCQQQ
jgi:hypothetical protein